MLTTIGVGSLGLLSGCSDSGGDQLGRTQDRSDGGEGDGSPGDGDAVESDDAGSIVVGIGEPANAIVDAEVFVPVSVTNEAADPAAYEDTLIANGSERLDFSIERIEPGETETVEVGPVSFDRSGRYRFDVDGAGVDRFLEIDPISNDLGESYEIDELDLTVTLRDVEFTPALFNDETELFTAPGDAVFAVFHLAIENRSVETQVFDDEVLEVANSELVLTANGEWLTGVDGIGGRPLVYEASRIRGTELGSGEQTSGWLLARLDRETAGTEVGLGYHRDGSTDRPDVVWTPDDEQPLPEFELESIDAPAEADVGLDGRPTYSMTVTNVGDGAGTFRGVVQRREVGDFKDWKRIEANLDSGETTTLAVEADETEFGTVHYRFQPFALEEWSVEFVAATRSFGESFTTPDGLTVTPEQITFADRYVVGSSSESREREADDGYTYAFVEFTFDRTNDDDTPNRPNIDRFSLLADREYDFRHSGHNVRYLEPIDSESLSELWFTYGPKTVWGHFDAPEDVTPEDVTISWSTSRAAVEWKP